MAIVCFGQDSQRTNLIPILHTAWFNNHALILKRNTAKYYFGEKFVVNQGKFKSNSHTF